MARWIFGAKIPSTLLKGGVGGWRRCFKHFLEYSYFSRLVKVIIRILQPFLCFFLSLGFIFFFFNLLNFYPVSRFLVTPILVTRTALGPVQTSCFCHAELNSGIKFDKSTASESNFWIKFDKCCRATRLWHGSDRQIIDMPRLRSWNRNIYINLHRQCGLQYKNCESSVAVRGSLKVKHYVMKKVCSAIVRWRDFIPFKFCY